jgi:uncharacterized RDD family membrane protein YckC
MSGYALVKRDQFVGFGAVEVAASRELLEALPFTRVLVYERIEIHPPECAPPRRPTSSRRAAVAPIEQTFPVTGLVTGEGVEIDLRRAGLGTRSIAAAIDLIAQAALLITLSIVDSQLGGGDDAAITALALTEFVLVFAGYPIVFEWLSRGRTLGKLAMGLRAVRDDGGPIGFRQALVRGLGGFVLDKFGPLFPLSVPIGMVTIGTSASSKRIGDMLAGTFVINERAGPDGLLTPMQMTVAPRLYGWAQALDLSAVNDHFALQLRQFVLRAEAMSPGPRAALGEQFRAQVLAITSPPPPPGVPTPLLLTTVLAERRRRAGLQATAGTASTVYESISSTTAPHRVGYSGAIAPDNPFTPPT